MCLIRPSLHEAQGESGIEIPHHNYPIYLGAMGSMFPLAFPCGGV